MNAERLLTPRGLATRRRLLKAAEEEFGQKGYHGTTTAGISSRARVSAGTLYLYFSSKQEVFLAVLKAIGARMQDALEVALKDAGETPARELPIRVYVDYMRRNRSTWRIVNEATFLDGPAFEGCQKAVSRAMAGFCPPPANGAGPESEFEGIANTILVLGQQIRRVTESASTRSSRVASAA